MGDNNATRRHVLGALLVVPAAAAAKPVFPATRIRPDQPSPDLTQAILYQRRANSLAHHYANTVHTPAYDRWQEAVARIPHVVTASSFVNVKGDRITLTTADNSSLACSRSVLSAVAEGEPSRVDAEYLATLREQVSAAEHRDAERDRLRLYHRVDATGERCDRLTDISLAAIDGALAIPARNVADLAAKIAFIDEVAWWDVPAAHDAISSDARRLAGEA